MQRRLHGEGLEAGAHVVDEARRRAESGEVGADGEHAAAEREGDSAGDPARRAGDQEGLGPETTLLDRAAQSMCRFLLVVSG